MGHYPNRIEAESMQLDGYKIIKVKPWEDASSGRGISCQGSCSATAEFKGAPGSYNLNVQYFDTSPGAAHFRLFVGDKEIKAWTGNADLPRTTPNGDTSTREHIEGVRLSPGDNIRIAGVSDSSDGAAIDYIEISNIN